MLKLGRGIAPPLLRKEAKSADGDGDGESGLAEGVGGVEGVGGRGG